MLPSASCLDVLFELDADVCFVFGCVVEVGC
jgi:hypothetical protein